MAAPPQVSNVLPASGPVSGGTQIVISGSGFSTATGVAFGALSATQYIVDNDTLLFVIAPPGTTPGSVPVVVITPSGNSVPVAESEFTYLSVASTAPPANPGPGNTNPGSTGTKGPGNTDPGNTTTGNNDPGSKAPGGKPPATADPGNKGTGSTDPTASNDPGSKAPASTPPASKPPASAPPDSGSTTPAGKAPASTNDNTPNYIPGGRMIVPEGKTGLGGTAGTGAGFGVGTLLPGGGGSASASNLSYYVDPGLTGQLVQTLIGLVQNAASPDALEAQNMILRRMALEGDLVGSRIPPPRNISEVGGYLNLLGTLKENTMREQTLAGILGVAGPAQPLGWISNTQPLAMVAVTNDRPAVSAQASFPLTVLVRSDFVSGVQAALKTIHSYGATLPLVSPPVLTLPPGGAGTAPPSDVLAYLGRTLNIAPSAALLHPAADPIALVRPTGTTASFALAANLLSVGAFTVTPADLDAVQCTPTSQTVVQLSQASFLLLAPILALAGFYPASPVPVPANISNHSWARLTNITGLVAGTTRLRDELTLLYRQDQIVSSVFAAMLDWVWNGSAFAP